MSPYRVLVADSHTLFRDALRERLQMIPDVQVVGEVGKGLNLRDGLNSLKPDLLIIDLCAPAVEWPKAIEQIRKDHPEMKILILSTHRELTYSGLAFKSGADGYLLYDAPSSELVKAVEAIRLGDRYLCSMLGEEMSKKTSRNGRPALTPRRQIILELVAQGKMNSEIADLLGLSVRTIEHHRDSIRKRLGLKSTIDLVKYAVENRII